MSSRTPIRSRTRKAATESREQQEKHVILETIINLHHDFPNSKFWTPSKSIETMANECDHDASSRRAGCCRSGAPLIILRAAAALVVFALLTVFITWLVLRPTKPSFSLNDAGLRQLNLSLPANLLSTVIQPTLSSRNPNGRVGVHYDSADTFAVYRGQQITLPSPIPPFYQGHGDVNIWSPYLIGSAVPLAPYLGEALQQDQSAAVLVLYVKIDGSIRWRVGAWTSGHYHLEVNCPAFFAFRSTGGGGTPVAEFERTSPCSVSV